MKAIKTILDHAGLAVFLSSVAALASVYFWSLNFSGIFRACLWLFIPFLFVLSIYEILNWRNRLRSSWNEEAKIILLYFEYIVMFAGIYALCAVLSNGEALSNHAFVEKRLMTKEGFSAILYLKSLVRVYIDALYFSVATATTLGFGDIHPMTPLTKLLVIIQVLSCLSVAVLGVGNFFSQSPSRNAP